MGQESTLGHLTCADRAADFAAKCNVDEYAIRGVFGYLEIYEIWIWSVSLIEIWVLVYQSYIRRQVQV